MYVRVVWDAEVSSAKNLYFKKPAAGEGRPPILRMQGGG
jgi:hypothetical protein